MTRSIPIAVAVVAGAILALYWSSGHLSNRPQQQKPDLPSPHDPQVTVGEDFDASLEQLKLTLAEGEPVVSSNGREKRRFSADSVETNLTDGTLALKGRVWHRDHKGLTDGRSDLQSTMTLDASTLKILDRSGRFEVTELVDPKQ